MSDDARDGMAVDPNGGEHDRTERSPARRAWSAPTIDEIDYTQTEAAYGAPGAVDFGTYTS